MSFAALNASLAESVQGIEVIKVTAQEQAERLKFRRGAQRFRDAFVRQGEVQAWYLPTLMFALAMAAGMLQGVWYVTTDRISIGQLVTYIGLLSLLRFPTQISTFSFALVQMGLVSARRILDLMAEHTELDENVAGISTPIKGKIEFEDVWFSYGSEPVLKGVSFVADPGETIAIVGETGSGKTTLTKLVNRIYDPERGRILIDGIDVKERSLDSLRSQISSIEQDIVLFSRPISENIGFSLGQQTDRAAIERAAKDAQADTFIQEMPEGYDTVIGERGVTLSGGQRQRLAIARALLTDPAILMLDDSTSAIDSATEDQIQRRDPPGARRAYDLPHHAPTLANSLGRPGARVAQGRSRRLRHPRRADATLQSLSTHLRPLRHAAIRPDHRNPSRGPLLDLTIYSLISTKDSYMGFIMEGLDSESYDRTYDDKALVRRILSYFKPQARGMIIVALLVVAASVMEAALPILISRGLDQLDVPDPTITNAIWGLIFLIFVAGVLSWLFSFVRQKRGAEVIGNVVFRLRLDAFEAVTKRDMSFFDEVPSGRIVSRVTSDTEDFANTVSLAMNLVSQVLLIVIIVIALLFRDVQLTLYALAIAPVVVLLALGFRKLARRTTLQAQRANSNVNTTIQEAMSGISVAKAFRQEDKIYSEFQTISQQAYKVTLWQGFVFSSIFPILFIVAGLGTTFIVYAGGNAVIAGDVSAGDWFLFLQSIALFWFPLTSIASFWSQFQQGLSAAERVFALIDATPRVVQRADHDPGILKGEIDFRDVRFEYVEGQPVLDHFTLHIPAGEMVALVGHTGAGKSTLGKLITRFYEFQDGQLFIDGNDIRFLDLNAYRRQVGVVPQTPFLFNGTVADNIRYPRPEATA